MTSKIIRACFVSSWAVMGMAAAAAQDSAPEAIEVEIRAAPADEWPTSPAIPPGDDTVDAAIAGAELRGHVKALSDDSLQGRPMGSDESLVAARYVAQKLEAMGFQPGASDGTFFQRIDLFKLNYTAPSELQVVAKNGDRAILYYGGEFTFDSFSAAMGTEDLRCVYVEDEEDLPAAADPGVALIFQTSSGKARRWLRDAGFANGAGFGMVLYPREDGKVGEKSVKAPGRLSPVASAKGGIAGRIDGPWGNRAYAGELETVRFVPNAEIERRFDVNVVGFLPGAGTEENPDLKNEVVMLTAHRDHIGLARVRPGQEVPDDIIMNGADDDASGCSVVLEVAEALASGERPARTVMVVIVTGEEVGMVGSGYWADSPTVDPASVICALNFEMLGRPDPMTEGSGNIWLTGDERSSLGPVLREHGVQVTPDVRPEQNFFKRSDNVSFARIGIVSQTLSSFGGHRDYHQASDEWDTLDYEHMEKAAAIALAAVRDLVSGAWTPSWNEGEPKL
ncbi:Aminopeptidase S [Planctomycetes bacterium Poly30]|uniref:Aminopeptidase S n=1 Tax=Saltatorellus ferox TaxID=2528018 RepID=A0A518EUJ0_9BACT|nr:Aminopeptidase S [Planctomycetes bacterium Poly30]